MKFTTDEEERILAASGLLTASHTSPLDWGCIRVLQGRYCATPRYYHTWQHALSVLSWVNTVADEIGGGSIAMNLAALFHDAVYTEQGSPENEKQSAVFMRETLKSLGNSSLQDTVLDNAAAMIFATASHGKINASDSFGIQIELFLDCDMASFAEPRWDLFVCTNNTIVRELKQWYSPRQIAVGRKKFLSSLIAGGRSVFLSSYFKERYEAQAKRNIVRLIEEM